MTQEFLSHMLGGRRESVTVAAKHLQDTGLITIQGGISRLSIGRDWEAAACECYRIVKQEFDLLLRAAPG